MTETVRDMNNEMLARCAALLEGPFASAEDLGEMASALSMDADEAAAYLVCAAMGLDASRPGGRERLERYLRPALGMKDPSRYLADPFAVWLRSLGAEAFPPASRITLEEARIPAMTLFPAGDLRCLEDGRVIQPLGFFPSDYRYPSLRDGGREWMSLHPNEIETILPKAKAAHGRVLCLGVGIGYYLYHAAVNPRVESITAVERDPGILRWFNRQLLPHFPGAEIRAVQGDALDPKWLRGDYDTVFADLWHDVSDGLPLWRRLKAMETPGRTFQYWLDETLACYDRGRI